MATPRCLQIADEAEEPLDGVVEQRTGGLVHEEDAGVHAERAGDGEQLALADGERFDRCVARRSRDRPGARNGRQNRRWGRRCSRDCR